MYNSPRHSIAVDDVVFDKFHDVSGFDLPQGNCFRPLGEVISDSWDEPVASRRWRVNRSHHVNAPGFEGPRCLGAGKVGDGLMFEVTMDLAFVTPLCIFLRILHHFGPIVAHPSNTIP